tara:strand:- start:38 stop:517 length:480 start_codon:yes stop_codon:yes gene_type:complete
MTTFYIYEVPGIKNGATKNWLSRSKSNFNRHQIQPIIIETIEGPDIEETWQVVGDREWELADLNGYPRGAHYVEMCRKGIKDRTLKQILHNSLVFGRSHQGNNGRIGAPKLYKLTKEIADQIRIEYRDTKTSHRKLASKYNISKQSIGRILRNEGYLTP